MRKIKTLKKNYEFQNVLTKGKFYIGKQITIYIAENKRQINQIGIAISKKTCNAVKRNHIKRKIRENYRLIQNKLKQGYNIVFLWNKKMPIEKADFYIIKQDIENLGIHCKYYPSCSEYMMQAIKKYGCIKGVYLGIKRLLKCHPFAKGGYDPLN